MKTIKTLQIILLTTTLFLFHLSSQAQKKPDLNQMRKMFEQRRPQLDTLAFSPEKYNLPFLSFETTTLDSIKIASWFIPNPSNKGTVLMIHGFDMNKSGMLGRASHFYKMGYSVVLPDLRARGESGGEKASTGKANATDVECVYNFCKEHLSNFGELILYGFSHGGRAAVFGLNKVGAKNPIILESPPFYLSNAFKRQYKIETPMNGDESEIKQALEAISSNPMLLLIGDDDTAINEEEGNELIGFSRHKKSRIIVFEETAHSVYSTNESKYAKTLHQFLKSIK